ncbi:MAG TPA: alpha/beta fold hydrolase [Bacteriovoracaceae bacterium]|nr:alpha/beta fold hydrolase [Bacteriovoracaceae bacterium]
MKPSLLESLTQARATIPPCTPPYWARTGHLQTLLGHLLPSQKLSQPGIDLTVTLETETERIHSSYLKGSSRTAVYLFHGLGGTAQASYMHRTAIKAQLLGHHVFINNHRGCGSGAGLASETYHSGRADDLSQVIQFGRKLLPGHKHLAIGFSLSANALLLLAAKVRASAQPDYAIAVNGPINLDRASIKLQQGLNRIYDRRFTRELENYLRTNRPQDVGDYSLVKDLRDFDQRYTAPLGGFKDRDDYYATCSAKQFLPRIDIPTVIITAEDDPFVSIQDYREASYSPTTLLHVEKHGGHMGYLSSNGLGFDRWLDHCLGTYLEEFDSWENKK